MELSVFEQMVKLALTNRDRLLEEPSETPAAEGFITVLEDLTWALLQIVGMDGSRVVHGFQTEPFAPRL